MLIITAFRIKSNLENDLAHVFSFLQPGSVSDGRLLDEFWTLLAPRVIVDLAVGDTVAPMIGFAFSQSLTATQLKEDAELLAVLDRCVESNLCTPQKRAALLSWPGRVSKKYQRYAWPARLMRWLDVKIVCATDGSVEAKGYLGFAPRFSLF